MQKSGNILSTEEKKHTFADRRKKMKIYVLKPPSFIAAILRRFKKKK